MPVKSTHDIQKGYALLLIDFQKDFLCTGGKMLVLESQIEPAIQTTIKAQQLFLERGLPVVRIGNEFPTTDTVLNFLRNGACVEGTEGVAWDERLSVEGTVYFSKAAGSAFSNEELGKWVEKNGITDFVVAGLQAKACVTATIKAALQKGIKVHLLQEALLDTYDFLRDYSIRSLSSLEGVDKFSL
ncbi:UNVERIFIED_CONTAM: hypothetical protein HDU68_003110 [Siphonaria sp. JEL0065]|nr:hypothetical protein HDU68_003110 [Siphonaria sp. JEL0065]